MFSTSMMASSTTTPMATTSPASTMTLIDASRRSRNQMADISDSGIATRLMIAVRTVNRNAVMMTMTSSIPRSRALVRLSIDWSTNVAGRKIVGSISIPGRPGCMSLRTSSASSVTSFVFAPRDLLTTSSSPSPPSMTASPHSCWLACRTWPMSFMRSSRPPRLATTTSASSSAFEMVWMSWMLSRCVGCSMKPP